MGMDVSGLNPKQNKNIDDFPTMKKQSIYSGFYSK